MERLSGLSKAATPKRDELLTFKSRGVWLQNSCMSLSYSPVVKIVELAVEFLDTEVDKYRV